MGPPPESTLFPYTTLFRSDGVAEGLQFSEVVADAALGVGPVGVVVRAEVDELGQPDQPRAPDRKSTRLNSSHMSISYAVFCLKKKNTPLAALRHLGSPRVH